ncbi:MAG: MobF family relaxase [Microthrixaceae bacterium]
MRVTTLKAGSGGVSALLSYYAGLAEQRPHAAERGRGPVDYYLDPDEPAGRWWGDGRHALGVSGDVAPEDLRAVLEGTHPVTGQRLGRSFGESSARGFDATFSASKSVSVLWALTPDPWVRAEVLAAHDSAVDAAMAWFQTHGGVTRRGKQGIDQVDTLGVTAALFRQHTSRTIDPQLHTHAVISAKVQDPTGRWLSLDARFLKYQQRTIGWIYDAALRAELTGRLGVAWTEVAGGQAELTQIPATLRELFSQRTAQVLAKRDALIERWSRDHDGGDPDARTIAGLERAAVLASRPSKSHGITASELHRSWADQAMDVGIAIRELTPEGLAAPARGPGPVDDAVLATEALRRVEEESSTWLVADLARHVATLLPPGAAGSASAHVAFINRIATSAAARCLELAPAHDGPVRRDGRSVAEHVTDRRLTTARVLGQEQRLQHWALTRAHPTGPGSGDPQADAAEAIAGAAGFVLVVGPAGTGKTRTTARAVQSIREEGRPVIGLAPSGKAADVLRVEAGCPTDTLAGFLTRHRDARESPWPAGTTVILDEAGMAATQDLAELLALAQRNWWRIVVVGDPAQLPAVGRGGVFAHWCATVPHHELDAPRRFLEPWEAEASLQLRAGEPSASESYSEHGRLHTTHPALLARRIADVHARHVEAGRSVAVTTTSVSTARDINVAIQARREPRDDRQVELADGTTVAVGDRIATRRNDPTLRTDQGEPVRNRQVWIAQDISPGGDLTVRDPERGTAVLPRDYVERHVELGWAVTGYGTQGDTVDVGIAVLEAGTSRNHAYVALTRGREANHAWFIDPTGTIDPTDQLEAMIARTPDQESALATLERLHEQAGLQPPAIEPTVGRSIDVGLSR